MAERDAVANYHTSYRLAMDGVRADDYNYDSGGMTLKHRIPKNLFGESYKNVRNECDEAN